MPFCGKCGSQVKDHENFCPKCGFNMRENNQPTPVGETQFSEKNQIPTNYISGVPGSSGKSLFLTSIVSFINDMGKAKIWFFATIGMFVLNFILSLSKMITFEWYFTNSSHMSIIKFFKTASLYFGEEETSANIIIPIFTILHILIAVSIILILLPILFGGKYNRAFLIPGYVSLGLSFLAHFILMIVLSTGDISEVIKANAWIHIYNIQTIATLLCAILFATNLKTKDKFQMGAFNNFTLPNNPNQTYYSNPNTYNATTNLNSQSNFDEITGRKN